MSKINRKRPASFVAQIPSQKRRLPSGPLGRKREKAADRVTIPIPQANGQNEELSDQDLDIFESYGDASFLQNLDQTGMSSQADRSKKEIKRLHKLSKPIRQSCRESSLPSSGSFSEEESARDSDIVSVFLDEDLDNNGFALSDLESDEEMPYEAALRPHRQSWFSESPVVHRLPIKLADGRIVQTGTRQTGPCNHDEVSSDDSRDAQIPSSDEAVVEDVSTGARFGRPAVADIFKMESRKAKIKSAKEQIANICQDILADPENSLGLLRRLHTFSLKEISSPSCPNPFLNDPIIRKLAFLSQLAVFKDIIPAYRIRKLTDQEKAEKVSQIVARTREWEQGLVVVYQSYLKSLKAALQGEPDLAELALQCMCALATEATNFNFTINLLNCIIVQLSRRSSWDQSSDLCLNTIITILRADLTGVPSLDIVRLLNRIIKERHFNVNPRVLSALLHLRLKTDLSVRASDVRSEKEKPYSKGRASARRARGKSAGQPHLSKKMKKALKENKNIERELREAEAEVDKEERATIHTETLKLLFVLYFSILKNPRPTPLLPAALRGISKYAHLVNVDFFKDLLTVLKKIVSQYSEEDANDINGHDVIQASEDMQRRLQCIVTAFELLAGQGEALNIDLNDFVTQLYAIIPSLSFSLNVEAAQSSTADAESTEALLFRALDIALSPRAHGAPSSSWRAAAFAKRLLAASLHWPASSALRALEFVRSLIVKDIRLEALLGTEGRTCNGIYRPEVSDPQLCNPFGTSFWELFALRMHYDSRVREEAFRLLSFSRT